MSKEVICQNCLHRACYVTKPPCHFVKWACRVKRISFGTQKEYDAGNNQVVECDDYLDSLEVLKQEEEIPKDAKVARNIERLKEAIRK